MSKQGSSRKSLIIGIIAAVVVLGVLLAVLLTQCTGNQNATESTPAQTTEEAIPTYELYWNLDRAEYDGKSEAGMSSRQQESDGYFHIRFFFEGETVELRAADRKVINAIDVNDVMGLEFDSNGIITGVTVLDDMPLEQVGWQFYVQSVGGKLLKLNSSKAMNGLEVMLDIHDFTGIWDMTGLEGEVGMEITPIAGDRVIAIANLAGELTHVYVYERPEFMQTFTGYCQHCDKEVEWKMWNKENSLPSDTGHYQLQNNVSGMSKQQYINEDQKVCLDLNGMQVDGKENARVYTLHYAGAHLAIMDTSEGQTGVLRGHSTASDQGGVVWVRYGQFHLYSGTLDGSDMVSKMNGAAMDIPKGAYFYMHGGKIIGGTAKAVKNDKGNWTNGLGGTMVVRGKFVMNGGVIEGGKATGVVTKYNADGTPNTYSRGIGGNIYVGSGGVVEMNGGTIKGGTATHSGGNVYVDGTGEFTMNGGTITGGKVTGKGRNGGNVFVTSKASFTLKSGQIVNGVSYNCAGNVYTNGKFVMTGGYIGGGKIYNWSTRKLVPTENRANVFSVQGDVYMYGGRIDGSFYAIDTAADNNPTIVYLTTYASIYGAEDAQCDDMVFASGGDGITCRVGNLRDSAKIGVHATTGIFTEPTAEANVDNFFSNIDDAEICYVEGCIALGRFSCLCGNNENGEAHYGECDGAKLFWGPLTGVDMPKVTGNYYIPRVEDENGNLVPRTINCKEQSSMVEGAEIKLDLNGGTLLAKEHYRFFSLHNPNTFLTITDSSEGKTGVVKSRGQGTTQGNVIWVRYGRFDLYGGTLDGSAYTLHQSWEVGTDGLFGTDDDKLSDRDGGTISMGGSTTFNMWGGTVIGNQAPRVEVTKTNKITTEVDGEEVTTTEEVKKLVGAIDGASLLVGTSATFNMYGGTIRDGYSENCGGNILANGKSVINLYAGTITGGQAGPAYKPGTTTVEVKGWGGNMDLASNSTLNILGEDVLITEGVAGGNGGNIRTLGTVNMEAGTISNGESLTDQGGNLFNSGTANLTGGLITGGKAKNGGNLAINSGKDTILNGVLIENGDAGTGYGGNIRMSTTNVNGKLVIDGDTIIRNGTAGYGANLAVATNNANKNNPVATVEINGGIIEKGNASANGANINISSSADSTATLTINGGIIREGVTGQNGGGLYASGVNTEIVMNGGTFTGNVARWGGSILLSSIKGMTINDGTIENGTTIGNPSGTSGNGGNLKIDGNVPITMNGGEIKNGKTGDFGGNVWTQGTFTMNGGTISGGEAKGSSAKGGGNLFSNNTNGKFYLNGGTIEGGVAGKGGNIMLSHAGAVCVVDGATITGGSTTASHGGNVNVASGTFTLKSGEVKDGVSKDTAGNIYANGGTVIIEGGKVYGGSDKNGAASTQKNIYIVSAAIELRGGEIDGAVGVINYNNNNGSVKMSGNPVIKSETTTGLTLTWSNGEGGTASKIPHINIDKPMTDGAEVYISSAKWEVGPITTATEEGYTKYFHADDEARSVGYAAGTIQLGKTHCLCGSTTETHKLGCDGKQLFWTPWAGSSSLPTASGNYYIHPSVTVKLSAQWKPAADAVINLDLAGRSITCDARVFAITNANSVVTMTDTVGGGKIYKDSKATHSANATGMYSGQGGIVWLGGGSTFNMIAGTIDGTGYINASNGGAVCIEGTKSTFNLYGGTIKGTNTVTNGGNVAVKGTDCEFHMYGGSIENGLAQSTGANIYATGNAKVFLHDGSVSGGKAGKDYAGGTSNGWGGNIELVGSSYLLIEDGVTISGGRTIGNGGNIRTGVDTVLEMTGGIITDGRCNDNGGNIFVQGSVNITGGEITNGYAKTGGNISFNSAKESFITGATISGGEATNQGGNVRVFNATTTILNIGAGTHIFGGKTAASTATTANLDVTTGCTIRLADCQIDGYASIPSASATIEVSGKTVITGGTTNLTLGGAKLNLKDLASDANIGINYAQGGAFTTATKEEYKNNFTSDDAELTVAFVEDSEVLALGKYYCLCGSTTEDHDPGCDGTQHFWQPWTSTNSLPKTTGYYYIQPNNSVTLSGQQKIETADQKIVLDLNGRTVKNAEGAGIRGYWLAASGVEVTITDTVGGGKIINDGAYDQGGIFWIETVGTKATLIKGTLDASGFTSRGSNSAGGVGICLANKECTFTMYGGEVLGGTCSNGGGAIFGSNWDSRVYIYGGEVIGNENEENPSVRLMGTKNEIENATVTGGVEINSYRFDGAETKPINQLTLKSGANVDSILIADVADVRENGSGNYTILPLLTVDGTLANVINITTFNEEPHVFSATAVDASVLSKFSSASSKLTVIHNTDGKLELITNDDPTYHCICGTPAKHQQGCDGTRYRFTEWTSTTSLPKTSGYYYLANNVELTSAVVVSDADQNIVLDLNGKTVSNKAGSNFRFYRIDSTAGASTLTITDCSEEQTGNMTNDGTYDQGMILWTRSARATYNLYNATLSTKDATFALNNGEPKNEFGGSAVGLSGAGNNFNMYSGKIIGGESSYGGSAVGVIAGSARFNLYGGLVKSYDAEGKCTIRALGAVALHGGKIEGGVEINDASDGTVSGLWLDGAVDVDFIKLTDAAKDGTPDDNLRLLPITIESALELEKPIKLYSQLEGVVTKTAEGVTLDETALEWFLGMNHAIILEGGQLKLVGGENVYCLCGSETETHAKGCDGTKYIWTALTKIEDLQTPGNYYLTDSLNVTGQYHFKTGETRLNLNGFTITDTSNRLFTTNGATECVVTITDTSAGKTGGLVVKHAEGYKYAGQGHALWFNGASTLNWIAGNIDVSSTTSTKYGGNAIMLEGNSTLNFYSGTITGGVSTRDASQSYSNWSEPCGGCIRINAGSTVNMYGGTIKNGRSVGTHGGNIALFGTMNMYGGVIENGSVGQFVNGTAKTNGHGGNISLLNANAVLNIEDGEIRNGTGVQWAGNIYGYYGTLQMSGGFIYGGKIGTTAASDTANIGMRTGFVAKLSGGNISGRIAMCAYNQTGTVYLSGSINLLNRTKDSYTDDGYRLKIYPADANGTPNINLIIGELDAGTILSITNARKTDFSVNGQTVNTNVKGQFATAAEGYTLTSADVSAVKVWYVGGSSGKTPGYADTSVLKSDNTIHFENLIADSAS